MTVEIWPTAAELEQFLPAGSPFKGQMMVRIHRAAWTDVGPARSLADICQDVVHDTEGNFPGDEGELTRLDDKIASAMALVGRTPVQGVVAMVPLNVEAYTPGNDKVAKKSINIELSGFQSSGYTEYQYQVLAALHRWAVWKGCPIPAEFVGTLDLPGIKGHQHVANPYYPGRGGPWGGGSNHTDPGPLFKWNYYVELCKGGASMPDPVVTTDLPYGGHFNADGMLVFNPTGSKDLPPVAFGFLEYFLTIGRCMPVTKDSTRIFNAVRMFGLPTEAAHADPDGNTRQKFERYKMTFDPHGTYGWELYGEFVS